MPRIPVTGKHRVSTHYGASGKDYLPSQPWLKHTGKDWVSSNRDVVAQIDGRITAVDLIDDSPDGKFYALQGGKYRYTGSHMEEIDVVVGQRVKEGQRIGEMGTTGKSTGVHLHEGLRVNGVRVDPKKYVTTKEDEMPSKKEVISYFKTYFGKAPSKKQLDFYSNKSWESLAKKGGKVLDRRVSSLKQNNRQKDAQLKVINQALAECKSRPATEPEEGVDADDIRQEERNRVADAIIKVMQIVKDQ